MTVIAPDGRASCEAADSASRQLMVGPDDGYGDITLERLSLSPGAGPCLGPQRDHDQLVVVLAGHARVTVQGNPAVTLGPDDVVHVGRGHSHVVEVLSSGPAGSLELLVLAGPDHLPPSRS